MESWTADEKQSSRVVKSVDRRCNSAKVRRKKIHPRQMLEKSRNAVFFQWSVCRVSRKVGLLKRRVRRYVRSREIKNCTPLWNAHFEVKTHKTRQVRSTFRSSDVEKLHAAVAKRTFWSQNVQNTSGSEHFSKFRCRKIARRCGETDILKSKCTKHLMSGPLLEVQMSKNWTRLWRNGHFEVKMPQLRSTFWSSGVKKSHAAVARSTFPSQNVKKLTVSEHFFEVHTSKNWTPLWREAHFQNWTPLWREAHFQVKMLKNWRFLKFWFRKIARRCGEKHMCKPHFEVQMSKNESAGKFVTQSISQVVSHSISQVVS